jgi:hypothetical protein
VRGFRQTAPRAAPFRGEDHRLLKGHRARLRTVEIAQVQLGIVRNPECVRFDEPVFNAVSW